MHAGCESLFTEDDVEQAADEGFDCVSCQPYVVKPVGEYGVLQGARRKQGEHALLLDSPLHHLAFCLFCSTSCPSRIGANEGERTR